MGFKGPKGRSLQGFSKSLETQIQIHFESPLRELVLSRSQV